MYLRPIVLGLFATTFAVSAQESGLDPAPKGVYSAPQTENLPTDASTQADQPVWVEPPTPTASVQLSVEAPTEIMSLLGREFQTASGTRRWRASYAPQFSFVLGVEASFHEWQLAYASDLSSRFRYQSFAAQIPPTEFNWGLRSPVLGRVRVGGSRTRGFGQNTESQSGDSDSPNASSVSFKWDDNTLIRPDVAINDWYVRAWLETTYALTSADTNGTVPTGAIDIGFSTIVSFRHASLSAAGGLVPSDDGTLWTSAHYNELGFGLGVLPRFHPTPNTSLYMGFSIEEFLASGRTNYSGSQDWASGTFADIHMGWNWENAVKALRVELEFGGTINRFSSFAVDRQRFGLLATYTRKF